MKIAVIHAATAFSEAFYQGLQARLKEHDLLKWEAGEKPPANDFDVVITTGKFSREQVETQSRLQLIQTASSGYDGIDLDAAKEKGILVAYAPSGETGNAISVAEMAMLLMLGASRKINLLIVPGAKAGDINTALHGKTVCIIGLGEIGRLLAEHLLPFGVNLTAVEDHPKELPGELQVYPTTEIKAAVADADYVVLCIRATSENENMVDAKLLERVKKGAILINIARGSLIDEAALAAALKSGQIGYAALDVVRDEPLQLDNSLLNIPQALITPHVAGMTDLSLKGMVDYVSRTVVNFADGKKPEAVV